LLLWDDLRRFYVQCREQDFAFYMAVLYLVFTYLRPQATFPILGIIPWTQISILLGLTYLGVRRRLRLQSSHIWLACFVLVAVLSAYHSQYKDYSLSKASVPFTWWVEVFFFTNAVKNGKQLKLLVVLLFLILFKMSLFGAKTWVGRGFGFTKWGIAGPTGFFANSGEFSLLMAMLAVLSLSYLFAFKKVSRWYYFLPVTAIMTVAGASSRGGQLALVLGLAYIFLFVYKIRFKSLLVVMLFLFLSVELLPVEQKQRFESMGEDGTSKSRLKYWTAGMDMIEAYPLTGVGLEAFSAYYRDYYAPRDKGDDYLSSRSEVSHNTFIQVGVGMGYPGLFLYVVLCSLVFLWGRKIRKRVRSMDSPEEYRWLLLFSYGLDAAAIAYLVGSFFMSVLLYPYIYLLLMLGQSMKNSLLEIK
jgi:putative inorganic carbon (HCO3(-)) transporter